MNGTVVFWIVIALFLGVLEAATVSLISIWGAVSALVCAVLSYFGAGMNITSAVFIIVTAVLLAFTRPLVKHRLNAAAVPTNADRIIGAEAVVIKSISPNVKGQVDVGGTVWTAVSPCGEISEGEKVKVISIEGVKAVVEPL